MTLDKERHLILNLNAMILYEEKTGKRIWDIGKDMSITEMRTLLWACLVQEDPDLDTETVGHWVDISNLNDIRKALFQTYSEAMPEVKLDEQSDPKDEALPSGTG